jgi:hypothetical protein
MEFTWIWEIIQWPLENFFPPAIQADVLFQSTYWFWCVGWGFFFMYLLFFFPICLFFKGAWRCLKRLGD